MGSGLHLYTKQSKIVSLHPNVANYIELSGYVNAYDYHIGSVAKVGESYGVLMSDVTQARNENGVPLLEWDDSWRGAYRAQSKTAEVVGNMTPDFLGSVATTLTWKDLSLNIGLDMRFGGLVASYCNLYGTQAGWTESSLQYRDPEHGGMTWTSQYADSKGIQYTDGMIPEGVLKKEQLRPWWMEQKWMSAVCLTHSWYRKENWSPLMPVHGMEIIMHGEHRQLMTFGYTS